MKPMAWASIVLALLLSASSTQGQGFRGGGGGMSGGAAISGGGSMGGFGSAGGTAGVGRGTIGTAPPAAPVSPAPVQRGGGFATAPQATAPSSAMQQQNLPSSTIGPQFRHRGGHGFIPPPPFVRPRPFFLGVAPFHPHRNWFFWRYPRFAFYDVPYFVDSGTVITQVAPGVIRADRDQSEESPSDQQTRGPGQLAPFDPTPQDVVERMLTLAAVKKGDVIYDLGAGDGRILITAARKYGVRGVGYEIDSGLAKLARENVRKQGVERLVEIRQED
ncbi:MAG TPA: class I SAM-dependent methyltransferase, partial [Candidatus Binatia bacterium]|nr:class I SAM-dependent methyltransferase [Candidatus Binatia bacterium]